MHGSIHLFDRLPQVSSRPQAANDYAPAPVRGQPLVGLIRNARSHRNVAGEATEHELEGVLVHTPRKRSELAAILQEFAAKRVDCIAIDGGDGTVRDVLTSGAGIFGDSWPSIIVLPNGKTNALAYDLGLPTGWSLPEALAAVRKGKMVRRQPLVITQRDNPEAQVRGFIMGGGAFNRAIALGQRSHDLGAFNAAVIGVTAVWSVLQALFGSGKNAWRQGTRMKIRGSDGQEIAHFGGLPEDERFLLFISTLRGFPAGLNPFRKVKHALGVAILDNPARSLLLRIAKVMRGTASEETLRRGCHLLGDTEVEVDLTESFILDGEAFPAGNYRVAPGATLHFVVP